MPSSVSATGRAGLLRRSPAAPARRRTRITPAPARISGRSAFVDQLGRAGEALRVGRRAAACRPGQVHASRASGSRSWPAARPCRCRRAPGPGRPERAITKASRIVRARSRTSVTSALCLVIGSVMPVTSISWKASVPRTFEDTWPGDEDGGRGVEHRGGDAGGEVGRPRARGGDRDPDLAARPRVAVGHVGGALLVPHEDVADRVVQHRVVGGQDRARRGSRTRCRRPPSPGIPRRSVRPFVALAPPREAQKSKTPEVFPRGFASGLELASA